MDRGCCPALSALVDADDSLEREESVRTFAKLMAPFLAPATARVERRLDRANIVGKLLLSFEDWEEEIVGGEFGAQCLEVESQSCWRRVGNFA